MSVKIPHWRIVIGFCLAAILGYAAASIWVVWYSGDAALRGDVIGTWKSFAVGAFAFWIGSSSGGKAKDDAPTPVTVTNTTAEPVPTQDASAVDDSQ